LSRSPRRFVVSCQADRGDADERARLPVCAWPTDRWGASSGAVVDALDHFLMLARLRILDALARPEPETPADQQRARDRERIERAFPEIGG
jgi:hypothetical protein